MVKITKEQVKTAVEGSDWDLGNKIRYDMCRKYPSHKKKSEILAKVWLIGRSYFAAIERRKNIEKKFDGDTYYLEKVAPGLK